MAKDEEQAASTSSTDMKTREATPPAKKKRKKKPASTPTDKKTLDEWSKRAKQSYENIIPGSEEQKERDAMELVANKCKSFRLRVSNSMWAFLSEVECSKNGEKIHLRRNQVNHNTVSPSLSNEITNNFLGNPLGADLTDKIHGRNMGNDMKCLLAYNTKASLSLLL